MKGWTCGVVKGVGGRYLLCQTPNPKRAFLIECVSSATNTNKVKR